jgi:hypothetical protein
MPGSRRYFGYFDDGGTEFYIQLDEGAGESLALGFAQAVTNAVAVDPCKRILPTNKFPIEPRYILAEREDADGRTVKRRFYVGATTAPAWNGTPFGLTIDGETWNITARAGEVRHYIPFSDTGLIDGDVEDNVVAL